MTNSKENSKKEASILFGLKKEPSLKVPKGYFEELPQKLKQIAKEKNSKTIIIHKWMIYSSTVAALIILGFFSVQQLNKQKRVTAFNKSFNNLTAINFEEELFPTDDLSMKINFEDDEELKFIIAELEKPSKKISLYSDDFNDFFESNIEYIY